MQYISLKKALGLLLLFLFFLQLIAAILVFYIFSYQKSLSVAINISGRQRMLTQKMAKESFIYAKNPSEENLNHILKTASLFNKSLYALKNGSKEMMLEKLNDKNALHKWKVCAELWSNFYKHILALKTLPPNSNAFEYHLSYIKNNNLKLLKLAHKFVLALQDLSLRKVRQTQLLLFISVLLNLIAVIGGFFLIKQRIILPLNKIISSFKEISIGNLNVSIQEEGVNEIRELARVAKAMTKFIGSTMKVFKSQEALQRNTQQVISDNTQKVLDGAKQVGDLVDRVNGVALTTKETIEAVNRSTGELSQAINEISESITRTASSTNEVRNKAENANIVMKRFGDHAYQIGKIVETIQKIAEETNLLALNATIEATRAGVSGKSFAVVANEIKELAQETAKSAKEISEMVNTIQEDVEIAINSMAEIVNSVIDLSEYANTIASAAEEQTVVVKDISDRIDISYQDIDRLNNESAELKEISEKFLSIASQLETPVESLREVIKEMTHVVSLFNVSDNSSSIDELRQLPTSVVLEEVYLDHLIWRSKAVQFLLNGNGVNNIKDDKECLLGQLLNNIDILKDRKIVTSLEDVKDPHYKLHQLIMEFNEDKDKDGASIKKRIRWLNTRLEPILENITNNLYKILKDSLSIVNA